MEYSDLDIIILCGGLGTRIRSVSSKLPKCLLPVQNKPFITFMINQLINFGFNKLIFAAGYKGDQISDFLKNYYPRLNYEIEIETKQNGTGAAVANVINRVKSNNFLTLNADTFLHLPSKFKINSDIVLLTANMIKSSRYTKINSYNGKIIFKKTIDNGEAEVHTGANLIRKNFFLEYLNKNNLIKNNVKFSLENDFISNNNENKNISLLKVNGPFIDIGIPSDYKKAHKFNFKI